MKENKHNPALDQGFQFLNSAEQAYGRLFYAAKAQGEVEIQLDSSSTAVQMRMKLYAFRRKIRGEQRKKGNFPKLAFLMEDLLVTLEGSKLLVRDHVESPPMRAVEDAVEAAMADLGKAGVDPFEVEVPGEEAAVAPPADSSSPLPDPQELEASRRRMVEKLQQPSPELYASNPYYSPEEK